MDASRPSHYDCMLYLNQSRHEHLVQAHWRPHSFSWSPTQEVCHLLWLALEGAGWTSPPHVLYMGISHSRWRALPDVKLLPNLLPTITCRTMMRQHLAEVDYNIKQWMGERCLYEWLDPCHCHGNGHIFGMCMVNPNVGANSGWTKQTPDAYTAFRR